MASVLLADLVTNADRRATYLASGAWDDTTLPGRVAHHAATRPTDLAVVDDAGRYTYERLAGDVAACAGGLSGLGVGPGSVVSLQLPNRYETVVAAVAVGSLGAIVNPLLPNYRAHELEHVWRTARPTAVLTPDVYRDFDHRRLVRDVADATGVRPGHVVVGEIDDARSTPFADLLASRSGDSTGSRDASSVSELIFTSGTEARPKAIMHTE